MLSSGSSGWVGVLSAANFEMICSIESSFESNLFSFVTKNRSRPADNRHMCAHRHTDTKNSYAQNEQNLRLQLSNTGILILNFTLITMYVKSWSVYRSGLLTEIKVKAIFSYGS